eukprot:scaffold12937_cov153-Cylindrotheca_fusiformis.AAC.1
MAEDHCWRNAEGCRRRSGHEHILKKQECCSIKQFGRHTHPPNRSAKWKTDDNQPYFLRYLYSSSTWWIEAQVGDCCGKFNDAVQDEQQMLFPCHNSLQLSAVELINSLRVQNH